MVSSRWSSPDPVQQFQLTGGVVAVVTGGLSDDVPVLLLDVRAVVLVPGPGPGEGQFFVLAPAVELPVDEL